MKSMKKRDRRKLQLAIYSIALITAVIGTVMSISLIAAGAAIYYIRKFILDWNEKRKADPNRMSATLPDIGKTIEKIKAVMDQKKPSDTNEEAEEPERVSSSDLFKAPSFNSISFDQTQSFDAQETLESEDKDVFNDTGDYDAKYKKDIGFGKYNKNMDAKPHSFNPQETDINNDDSDYYTPSASGSRFRGIKF